MFNVLDTWLEPARFYADVQYLMALQMIRLALGGAPVATEAPQVVTKNASAFLMCVGLNGLVIGGLCLLFVMKNDLAQAQGSAYSKSEQRAPAYTAQDLALARQTLADGLRKLYESNQGGGFTCYESNQDGFTCMKRA